MRSVGRGRQSASRPRAPGPRPSRLFRQTFRPPHGGPSLNPIHAGRAGRNHSPRRPPNPSYGQRGMVGSRTCHARDVSYSRSRPGQYVGRQPRRRHDRRSHDLAAPPDGRRVAHDVALAAVDVGTGYSREVGDLCVVGVGRATLVLHRLSFHGLPLERRAVVVFGLRTPRRPGRPEPRGTAGPALGNRLTGGPAPTARAPR